MSLYTDYKTIEDTVTDASAINNSIKNILFTREGSLPGKPTFGSRLNEIIFNQLDYVTESLLKDVIEEALRNWETRILVSDVEIKSVPEYNKIIATIYYTYRDKGLDINEQISIGFVQ